mmetsp:Transcript_14290/g.36482  ORF Transcript_14290/g.36482 Transcript_14290/m.36482 type:complete len:115 (+) Transcript_14290:56-400(+)
MKNCLFIHGDTNNFGMGIGDSMCTLSAVYSSQSVLSSHLMPVGNKKKRRVAPYDSIMIWQHGVAIGQAGVDGRLGKITFRINIVVEYGDFLMLEVFFESSSMARSRTSFRAFCP